jgi:hypothetical protein
MTKARSAEIEKTLGITRESIRYRNRFPWPVLITVVPAACAILCLYGMIENFLARSWVETGVLGTCVSACTVCVVLILKYTTRST